MKQAIISRWRDGGKYIVVEHEQDEYLVCGPLQYHRDIYEDVCSWMNAYPTVLGGGLLEINDTLKTIHTYGKSGAYGKPDPKQVEDILKSTYPDYTLNVTVTDYVQE